MNVRARVLVTLDLAVSDTWDPTVTADQVQKQAKESAIGIIRHGLVIGTPEALIIGTPKVTMILVDL